MWIGFVSLEGVSSRFGCCADARRSLALNVQERQPLHFLPFVAAHCSTYFFKVQTTGTGFSQCQVDTWNWNQTVDLCASRPLLLLPPSLSSSPSPEARKSARNGVASPENTPRNELRFNSVWIGRHEIMSNVLTLESSKIHPCVSSDLKSTHVDAWGNCIVI